MFNGLRHRRSMFVTSNSCSSCPTPSLTTKYRWWIEVAICTAGQSVRAVLLSFAFMESLRISGFRPSLVMTCQRVRSPVSCSWREISSVPKASRLQTVTLSQPATDSQLLALASTWPTLASTEAIPVAHELNTCSGEILTVDLPQAIGLTGRHIDPTFKHTRR